MTRVEWTSLYQLVDVRRRAQKVGLLELGVKAHVSKNSVGPGATISVLLSCARVLDIAQDDIVEAIEADARAWLGGRP
jgi:hypothetical protein